MQKGITTALTLALIATPALGETETIQQEFYGCQDWDYYERIMSAANDHDTEAFGRLVTNGLLAGICVRLQIRAPRFDSGRGLHLPSYPNAVPLLPRRSWLPAEAASGRMRS